MQHGYYELAFDGALGSGVAMLVFDHGLIFSATPDDARTSGIYDLDADGQMIDVSMALIVPPVHASAAPLHEIGDSAAIEGSLPVLIRRLVPLADKHTRFTVDSADGPVHISLRRISPTPND